MRFAKLISDKKLKYFFQPLKIDGKDIFTNDKELLLQYGWKEVINTEAPETEEGFYADYHYEETENEIIQEWEILPLPEPTPEEQLEDAVNALNILGVNADE